MYEAYTALDNIEKNELAQAVKAHGGQFDFNALESDGPIILASFKHTGTEDFYVYRVELDSHGNPLLYGRPVNGYCDEDIMEVYVHGQYGYVTDAIPEPEN